MTFPAPPPPGQPDPPGLPVESRDAIEAALLRRAPDIARTGPGHPGRRIMLDCAVNDVLSALLPHLEAFAGAVRGHAAAELWTRSAWRTNAAAHAENPDDTRALHIEAFTYRAAASAIAPPGWTPPTPPEPPR